MKRKYVMVKRTPIRDIAELCLQKIKTSPFGGMTVKLLRKELNLTPDQAATALSILKQDGKIGSREHGQMTLYYSI